MGLVWGGNFGGLADTKWNGIVGSFSECVGIDGHSTPGVLQVQQKLTKASGALVDSLARVKVSASNGYTFFFSYTTGKIWARLNSTGVFTLAYTTIPTDGGAGCLGAKEFNGYIYWATQNYLHRISLANADDVWAGAVPNFQHFANGDAAFHPMEVQDLTLFIGDGKQLASFDDAAVWNNNALDLVPNLRASCLQAFENDLLIGTYIADTVNTCQILRWDCVSPSWTTSQTINEVGINAFIVDDFYVYAQAGIAGNIYYYNGEKLVQFRRIPGTYSNSQYGKIWFDSVANYQGRPVFGFSNGSGDPAHEGVYTFGSHSYNYPKVMDFSFPISERSGANLVMTGLQIGAVVVSGADLMVAWQNGSNFGIDVIDYSNKLEKAYIELPFLNQSERDVQKTFMYASALYNSLPASTNVVISTSVNGGSYSALTMVNYSNRAEIRGDLSIQDVSTMQIRLDFTVSGNNAPVVEAIAAEFE